MLPTRAAAEQALEQAHKSAPGPWADHARYVALACQTIASRSTHLDVDAAYRLLPSGKAICGCGDPVRNPPGDR